MAVSGAGAAGTKDQALQQSPASSFLAEPLLQTMNTWAQTLDLNPRCGYILLDRT